MTINNECEYYEASRRIIELTTEIDNLWFNNEDIPEELYDEVSLLDIACMDYVKNHSIWKGRG